MTPKQADQLVRDGATIRLVDKYGDTGVMQVTGRDRRHIIGTVDGQSAVIDRTDIAKWEWVPS